MHSWLKSENVRKKKKETDGKSMNLMQRMTEFEEKKEKKTSK